MSIMPAWPRFEVTTMMHTIGDDIPEIDFAWADERDPCYSRALMTNEGLQEQADSATVEEGKPVILFYAKLVTENQETT